MRTTGAPRVIFWSATGASVVASLMFASFVLENWAQFATYTPRHFKVLGCIFVLAPLLDLAVCRARVRTQLAACLAVIGTQTAIFLS